MLNYDLAKKIDEKRGSNKYRDSQVHYEDILDQFAMSGIDNPKKCIQLRPELFLGEREYLGEHDRAYIKVNNTKSKFSINIESLVTNEVYSFDSGQKTKIKTPYTNNRIFTAGQIVDRKYKQSINFEPKENEGVRFDSKVYKDIASNSNMNFKTKNSIGIHKLLDLNIEDMEYQFRYNNWGGSYNTFSISDIRHMDGIDITDEEIEDFRKTYSLFDYIEDKYIVFPYKVTENWQLAFEIDVDSKDTDKLTKLSSPIEISYYIWVLKYSDKYMSKILGNKNILFEIASLGRASTGVGGGLSKLGKYYKESIDFSKVHITAQIETIQLDDFSIDQYTSLIPTVYDEPYHYDLKINEESRLHFHYPKVISMIPVFD
ncbi:hypothetical protein QI229_13305 [Staphylococcus saprophyticus]|nr:hypothetical protein [Staphylococcus saprophyticus]